MYRAFATLVIITITWFAGSVYWYVCNVQYVCQRNSSEPAITQQAAQTGREISVVDETSDALVELIEENTPPKKVDLTLYFYPDSTEFVAEQDVEQIISQAVVRARSDQETRIRVDGYTALVGPYYGNCNLMSQQRSARVADLLVRAGVEPARIETVGNAAANPIGDNSTSSGMALNRRATITIY